METHERKRSWDIVFDGYHSEVGQQIVSLLLEDYKLRTSEILKRVELQQNILKFQFIVMGAIIAAAIHLLNTVPFKVNVFIIFLLIAPLPYYFMSWSFFNHDFMIGISARYTNVVICPKLRRELLEYSLFAWEDFIEEERKWRRAILPKGLTYGDEYILPLFVPIMCIFISSIMFYCAYFSDIFSFDKIKFELINLATDLAYIKVIYFKIGSCASRFFASPTQKDNRLYIISIIILLILNGGLLIYTTKVKIVTKRVYARISETINDQP